LALFARAVTRLAEVANPYSDLTDNGLNNIGDILDAFGIGGANDVRDDFATIEIEDCVSVPGECNLTISDQSPTSGELTAALTKEVGEGLVAAIADLDNVSESFSYVWADQIDGDTEFDYSDALMFKGIGQAMLVQMNWIGAYDLDVDLVDVQDETVGTPEDFLIDHPTLGTLASQAKLTQAETYLYQAIDTMLLAIDAVEAEIDDLSDNQSDDLISFTDADEVEEFRVVLFDAQDGLIGEQGDVTVALDGIFNGFDIREQLPPVVGDVTGEFPDETLNGVIYQYELDINEDLDGDLRPDLINDYSRFFTGLLTGMNWQADNQDGYVKILFDATGYGFTYVWGLWSSDLVLPGQESGTWSIDDAGILQLDFDVPVDPFALGFNTDGIKFTLISADDWGISASSILMLEGGTEEPGLDMIGYLYPVIR
jgi:hypothetical protein